MDGKDSGSQKVQHYLDVILHKIKIVGPTIEVKTKNSTELSWVAATRSKSVEFFVFTSIVSELSSTGKASFHFHAALFGIRSPQRKGVGAGLGGSVPIQIGSNSKSRTHPGSAEKQSAHSPHHGECADCFSALPGCVLLLLFDPIWTTDVTFSTTQGCTDPAGHVAVMPEV